MVYIDYGRHALRHVQYGGHIHSREYASNVKCMYTSAPGYFINSSEFI